MMADVDIQDLSDLEFDIPCEWPDCENSAAVMGKGCADSRHVAVCMPHHDFVQQWFDLIPPYRLCLGCGSPMLVFDHHFDIQPL